MTDESTEDADNGVPTTDDSPETEDTFDPYEPPYGYFEEPRVDEDVIDPTDPSAGLSIVERDLRDRIESEPETEPEGDR